MSNSTVNNANDHKVNLIKWVYPVLIVFGVAGNLMSIKLIGRVCQRSFWLHKFFVLFVSLSFSDLTVLILGCGREYLDEYHEIKLRSSSLFACKFIFYFNYLFGSFSAYLNVFIAVSSATGLLKIKQSYIVIAGLFFVLACINIPFLIFTSLNENIHLVYECQLNETPYELEIIFFDNIICSLVPLLLAVIFSSLSLYKLLSNISNSDDECQCSVNKTECSCVRKEKPNDSRERIIVSCMTICYVITSIPLNYFIVQSWSSLGSSDSLASEKASLYSIGKILNFFKCSINIFFYILLDCSLSAKEPESIPLNSIQIQNKRLFD